METSTTPKNLGFKIAISLLALILIVHVLYTLQSIVIPILFAIVLSVMLFPLSNRFEKWGFNRLFSTLCSLLVAAVIISLLTYFIVAQTISIGENSTEIVGKIENLSKSIENWLASSFGISRSEIFTKVEAEFNKAFSDIAKSASAIFGSVGNTLTSTLLIPIVTFFFLYYRDFFKTFFFKAFSSVPEKTVGQTLTNIYEVLQNYMVGQVTVMGIVAVLNTLGLWIIGIDHAWFFGTLAALLMILPYIGIAIGSILPAIFALASKDNFWYAGGVVIWFQVVQFLEANFITPNIVGGKVSLNPLVSILAIFLGGMLFGFSGFILALPLTASIKVILDSIPETQAYAFLLSDPEKNQIRTERQKLKASFLLKKKPARKPGKKTPPETPPATT
jgi:predicted PurR-regulated permease PerM